MTYINYGYESEDKDDYVIYNSKEENINFEEQNEKIDYECNIVFLGEESVNKNYIIKCYLNNQIIKCNNNNSLIGFEREVKKINWKGKNILLNLMDVASQEIFKTLTKCIYEKGNVFLIFFSYENEESFNRVNLWYDNIVKYKTSDNILIFIVGLNYDQSIEKLKTITNKELIEKNLDINNIEFILCDEKNIKSINKIFEDIIEKFDKNNKNSL